VMPATNVNSVHLTLDSPAATAALAAWVAARAQAGDVIALAGGLGAGKTAFARAFIRARPGGERIGEGPSPTLPPVQTYDLAPPVWHFDLYRLSKPDEAWELGIEDAFADAISLVEWPERLGSLLPPEHLAVCLAPGATPDARRAELTAHGAWVRRIE